MARGSMTEESIDLNAIDAIAKKHSVERGAIIPILQEVQDTSGYVPKEAIQRIALVVGVPASEIYGIVTFYAQFRLEPLGKYLIRVCHGTACHLCGAELVADILAQVTGAKEGETSEDRLFTVERVACLGCCSLAPCIMINEETHGRLTPEAINKIVSDIKKSEAAASAG
jgi:NADH-quinone oxidoreductase subunit E